MFKAVIFDMDGVLVDSEPKNLDQLKGFYKSYGTEVGDDFMHSLVGSSYTYTYKESMRVMKLDWPIEKFKEKFDAYCKIHSYDYDSVLNPGVKEILIWLKEHGYKTAVASSSTMHQIKTMENVCNLVGCFEQLLSGEMFSESKPNPEIYLTAAEKLQVKPEECIAIEDSKYGIAAGNAAGMRVLAYVDDRYGVDQSKAYAKIYKMQEIKKYLKD